MASYFFIYRYVQYLTIITSIQVDYLVDCWFSSEKLYLLSGSYNGHGQISSIEPLGHEFVSTIQNGHNSMIRCCRFRGNIDDIGAPPVLLTGAEDARYCVWSYDNTSTAVRSGLSTGAVGGAGGSNRTSHDGSMKERQSKSQLRYKPY